MIQNNVAVQTEIEGITSLLAYSITADWESDEDENFDDIDITVTAENVMPVSAKKKKATCAICKETDSQPHNSLLHKEVRVDIDIGCTEMHLMKTLSFWVFPQ